MSNQHSSSVLRILDANLNRLREALRVIEEHFRFISTHEQFAAELKLLRHRCADIEQAIGRNRLLQSRDTDTDPFAGEMRCEEMGRETTGDVLAANSKRAQEAARVIEEYAKADYPQAAQRAKSMRFSLYKFEKNLTENLSDG